MIKIPVIVPRPMANHLAYLRDSVVPVISTI